MVIVVQEMGIVNRGGANGTLETFEIDVQIITEKY